MQILTALFADDIQPGEDGKPNVNGVFSVIQVSTTPVVHSGFVLLLELGDLSSYPERLDGEVELITPSGRSISKGKINPLIDKRTSAAGCVVRYKDVALVESGQYSIRVFDSNGKTLDRKVFLVDSTDAL